MSISNITFAACSTYRLGYHAYRIVANRSESECAALREVLDKVIVEKPLEDDVKDWKKRHGIT